MSFWLAKKNGCLKKYLPRLRICKTSMWILNTAQLPWGLSDKVDYGYRKHSLLFPHSGDRFLFEFNIFFFLFMCQVVLGSFPVTFHCVALFCCFNCSIVIVSITVCHWICARHHWPGRTNKSILFVLHWLDVAGASLGSSVQTHSFALGGSNNCGGGAGRTQTAYQRSGYCHHRDKIQIAFLRIRAAGKTLGSGSQRASCWHNSVGVNIRSHWISISCSKTHLIIMTFVHITTLPTAGSGTYVNMMQINFCNYNGT